MRVVILALLVLGIILSPDGAKAGLSATNREETTSVDQAPAAAPATQEAEDLIGLDKGKHRGVQRRLSRLGFDIKVNGKFDAATRAVITRWQAARGYPETGFLNIQQYEALLSESVLAAHASSSDKSSDVHSSRRRGGIGGPVGLIGGVVGGLFGRR